MCQYYMTSLVRVLPKQTIKMRACWICASRYYYKMLLFYFQWYSKCVGIFYLLCGLISLSTAVIDTHTCTYTPAFHPWCVRACCVHSRPDSACLTLLTWVHSFLRWLAAHANTTQPWLAVRATLCPSHNAPGPSPSIDAELASLSRYSDLLPFQS